MTKIVHVAVREFVSTVATKGFIIGVLVTPLLIGLMVVLMPILMSEEAPRVEGEVAVVDPTGEIFPSLAAWLEPTAIASRREDLVKRAREAQPEGLEELQNQPGQKEMTDAALAALLGEVPELEVVSMPVGSDLEAAKLPLFAGGPKDGGRLALVVVDEDAVRAPEGTLEFGSYRLFVREKLDDRIIDEIRDGLRTALVHARVEGYGLDQDLIEAISRVPRVESTTVTEAGEKTTNEALNMLLPAGFMILLLVSVLTGGQYLMTTTIEEKSSRVVEVLLSAVSPMELMAGKVFGQLCVGFVILALYAGMGLAAMITFAVAGLLEPMMIVYLILFFLIAYFVIASLMAAIGSAVNEMREAQTLMTPVMVIVMLPWLLWLPITRNPDSAFSVITSFIPPINSFVMLLRLTSTSPPPGWQVWLSIAIGAVSAWAALWFAGKVFRIGLLMFGKPPNFATLVRWARMA